MAEDQALLAAARAGDQRAFAALYRANYRRALHEARKVVANRSDAEDCAAAAFASTFQAIRKGGGPTEAFRPYLLTAVRNAALQLVRLKRYGNEVTTDEVEPPAHVDLYEIGADPVVRNAFASLPTRWREVLWKTEIEGVAPRDLATELAMSANGVAALAKRARDGFRKAYLTEAVGPEPHPWAMERLSLYREGALDPRTRDLVELHLENCARCQDALAPVPVTAASVGAILLAAGVLVPTTIGGAAASVGLVARVRHLRPHLGGVSVKVATVIAAIVAVAGTVFVVYAAQGDDERATPSPASTPLVFTLATSTTAPPTTAVRTTIAPTTVPATTAVPTTASTVAPPVAEPVDTEPPPTTVEEAPPTTRRRTTTTRPRTTTRQTTPPTPAPTTPPTEAPTTEAPTTTEVPTTTAAPTTTEAPTTTAAPTTTTAPPAYGGTLDLIISRPSYTAVAAATAADGLPAGTTITLQFTSTSSWSVSIGPATRCSGLPSTMTGGAGETQSASCSTPALPQGTTAQLPFTTSGADFVTVVVRGQRPGGPLAVKCDPSSAC